MNIPSALTEIRDQLGECHAMVLYPPCVYFLCHGDDVVYVGQSQHLQQRICEHTRQNVKEFDRVFFLPIKTTEQFFNGKHWRFKELDEAELAFIRALRPVYNRQKIRPKYKLIHALKDPSVWEAWKKEDPKGLVDELAGNPDEEEM